MKRNLAKYFSHFQGINLATRDVLEYIEPELTDSALDQILKEIFSVDPVSGTPMGDIAYFLSKDGNPQVKAWLESNLLSPRAVNGMQDPAKVSDDLIVEMSRKSDESTEGYASRLMSIYDEAKSNIDKLRNNEPSKIE